MESLRRSVVVTLVLLFLAACDTSGEGGLAGGPGAPGETVTITAVATTWNGWDPDDDPVPETTTHEVAVGDTFSVHVLLGEATFEVLSIEDGVVELRSDMELAPRGSGTGFNYRDLVTAVSLSATSPVELSTPTTDVATVVELTLG